MRVLRKLEVAIAEKSYDSGIKLVQEAVEKCRDLSPDIKVGSMEKVNTTEGFMYLEDLSAESKVHVACDRFKCINNRATSIADTLAETEKRFTDLTVPIDLDKRNRLITNMVAGDYFLNNVGKTFEGTI